jgi:5-methylcytosine-specific restriction endonuclease McrA
MKVKKHIGESINGFKIIDSYVKNTPKGTKVRKVLLKCDDCGRVFERCSSVDFWHIKCKCKCKYLAEKKPRNKKIEWNGGIYSQTEFCKIIGINERTFSDRIARGMIISEAIKQKFTIKCQICDKEFIHIRPDAKYCSSTCANRASHKKGRYKQSHIAKCIVCGSEFETIRDDAITCSKECRKKHDHFSRIRRYKNLIKIGHFDFNVTLEAVYERFEGKCKKCGKELNFDSDVLSNDYPSIDHIIPLCKGGYHEWSNVQLLCRGCNCLKGKQ